MVWSARRFGAIKVKRRRFLDVLEPLLVAVDIIRSDHRVVATALTGMRLATALAGASYRARCCLCL
jgi:hypothetical protein